jgi:hypothetical protein
MTPWPYVTSSVLADTGDEQPRTIALHLVHLATRHTATEVH